MAVYNGLAEVSATMFWSFEAPAGKAPFYFDGVTFDEFFVEKCYHDYYMARIAPRGGKYKPLRKQLEDGDIASVPNEYKILCPDPDNCTAFNDLIKIA